jgi:GNAT superfamily N-acetyltransferase
MNTNNTLFKSVSPTTWVEMLRGGDKVLIRPIHRQDVISEQAFIDELSPAPQRFRFVEAMKSSNDDLLRQIAVINPLTDVAYVAVVEGGAQEQQVGVARFSRATGTNECEFGLAVTEKWRNKGLGTHLMHRLINAARMMGLDRIYSSDPTDNELMRRFATHLRLEHEPDPDDDAHVLYSLGLKAVELSPAN